MYMDALDCFVLFSVEKFEAAAKKCKVAEYTSCLSTAESDVEKENRRIKCRTFPSEQDSPPTKQKRSRSATHSETKQDRNQRIMAPPVVPPSLLTPEHHSATVSSKNCLTLVVKKFFKSHLFQPRA
jgi:hypothetical protein